MAALKNISSSIAALSRSGSCSTLLPGLSSSSRWFSTSSPTQKNSSDKVPDKEAEKASDTMSMDIKTKDDKDEWWFKKLLHVRKIETPRRTQSKVLSDLSSVYEMQIHRVKPELMQQYLEDFERFVTMMSEKQTGGQLCGSWTVMIGDQDEAIHLWKYPGGYPAYNEALMTYRTDQDVLSYRLERNKMLRSRMNQIMLRFAFWDFVKQRRDPQNMYELRSYTLRPGTMIEWGNQWARGIQHRQENNESVCGFFSHLGELYMAHHLWAYKDLQIRKETREAAWARPGWDENVQYTVPLIRHLQSRILIPTPFSPLQ